MKTRTAQQMAAYFSKHVMLGRGQWKVMVDSQSVVTPQSNKTHDDSEQVVFVSLRDIEATS